MNPSARARVQWRLRAGQRRRRLACVRRRRRRRTRKSWYLATSSSLAVHVGATRRQTDQESRPVGRSATWFLKWPPASWPLGGVPRAGSPSYARPPPFNSRKARGGGGGEITGLREWLDTRITQCTRPALASSLRQAQYPGSQFVRVACCQFCNLRG